MAALTPCQHLQACIDTYDRIYPKSSTGLFENFRLAKQLADGGVKCTHPRELVTFCSRVSRITEKVMVCHWSQVMGSTKLRHHWKAFLDSLAQKKFQVLRDGYPKIELDFPVSRAILHGEDLLMDDICILDPKDEESLDRVIEAIKRISHSSLGYSFGDYALRALLSQEKTRCVYAKARNGLIVGTIWGVQLEVEGRQVFYTLQVAREPEYRGQTFFLNSIGYLGEAIGPEGLESEFMVWLQEKDNSTIRHFFKEHRDWVWAIARPELVKDAFLTEDGVFRQVRLVEEELPFPKREAINAAFRDYCSTAFNSSMRIYWEFSKDYISKKF